MILKYNLFLLFTGAHSLANKATTLYESARESVQRFVNAQHREEIVFTRGATDAINIISQAYSIPSDMQLLPGNAVYYALFNTNTVSSMYVCMYVCM